MSTKTKVFRPTPADLSKPSDVFTHASTKIKRELADVAATPASVGSEAKGEAAGSIGDDAAFKVHMSAVRLAAQHCIDVEPPMRALAAYIDSLIAAAKVSP